MLGCPRYSEGDQAAWLRGACGVGISNLQGRVTLAAKWMGRLRGMHRARKEAVGDFAEAPIVVIGIEQVDYGGDGVSSAHNVHYAPILRLRLEQVGVGSVCASTFGSSAKSELVRPLYIRLPWQGGAIWSVGKGLEAG